MKLYSSVHSGNCYKVRLLLSHLQIDYDIIEVDVVDRSNRQDILGERNPILRVPTLVLDTGESLGESNAILWYLAKDTQYLPEDEFLRYKVLQGQFFEQNNHEPNIAVARFWLTILKKPEQFREPLKLRQDGGKQALDIMNDHLEFNQYFTGDKYSIADISLYAYTHVAEEAGIDTIQYVNILPWLARIESQDGFIAMNK